MNDQQPNNPHLHASPGAATPPPPGYARQPYSQPTTYVVAPNYVVGHAVPGRPTNGLATAALTLGILAATLFWVPIVGLVLALVGIGLGIAGIVKAGRISVGLTPAVRGLSLSGVGVLLFLLIVSFA